MQKSPININFAQGLNLKTDPWQVPVGQFEDLENSIFQKGGLLQKRNGYGDLTLLSPNNSYLTTLNDNLVSIGNTVSAYSSSLEKWITKGTLQPCALSVLPLIRNNLNQTQNDTAVANGMVITTYTQTKTTTSAVVTQYLYALADSTTGQNIIEPTAIPVLAGGSITGSSRVFVVGTFFLIVSPCLVSSTTFLQYVSIPINNPVNTTTNAPNVSAAQNVHSEAYIPLSSNPGWDGVAANTQNGNTLVLSYNTTTGGQGIHTTILSESQISSNQASSTVQSFTGSTYKAGILSICVDLTVNPNLFYISFWNPSTSNAYTAAVTVGFGSITSAFIPQETAASSTIANLASAAKNGTCTVFQEVTNGYSYDNTISTNYINGVTVSSTGTVGSPYVAIRSVGLASKAFIVGGLIYFLAAYSSLFQPTYFLINGSSTTSANPVTVAKLAYENGGGYCTLGLPSVSVSSNVASVSYLYKDDVEALNTLNNPQQTTAGGIYSQTGINLSSFTIGTLAIDTAEIGSNLHISGGYLSHFDAYLPVEHNFFLFPDNVELVYTEVSTVTPTGTTATGSFVITAVSSVSGIYPGMTITGTGIPTGAVVTLVGTTTITISLAATGNHTSETLTIQGNIAAVPSGGTVGTGNYYYQVTYEWTDNQGLAYRSQPSIPVTYATAGSGATGTVTVFVPTLRLTQKIANPVKIVIYRWSEFTQVYNQVTSITAPVLNDTTTEYVSFVDTLPDADVVGNNILYTTGGVVPDCNAPACNGIMTLFDTRLWMVSAEDPNTLWLSKQVIEATPVEMSQLFTIYVAPNTGTVQSTGPITALAPMDDKLIIFKNNAIFYINGTGPNNLGTTSVGCPLGQYSQPIFVTSVVGCTNQASIVLMQDGLMFQSDKGIYLLGRDLSVSYIGAEVEDFNSQTVNSANIIPDSNFILFTLNSNTFLMYDWYFKKWGTFVGNSAISSCIYQGLHTLIDIYGRILQETPGLYLDSSNPVLMSFTTSWFNLAGLQGYERFFEFYLLGMYLSPHKLNIGIAYDYNPSIVQSSLITPDNFSSAVPSSFGVPTPFGSVGNKEQWRIHAKKQLCESFQITVQEVYDPSFGVVPGAGFTMSGLDCLVGIKKGYRPTKASNSIG